MAKRDVGAGISNGREQERKVSSTTTGAGETSVPHARTEADPDFADVKSDEDANPKDRPVEGSRQDVNLDR